MYLAKNIVASCVLTCTLTLVLVGCSKTVGPVTQSGGSVVADEGSASVVAPEPANVGATLSLEDSQDRALINELLDYFTEVMAAGESLDAADADAEEMVAVALQHIGMYDYDLLEDGEYPDVEVGGGLAGYANGRVQASSVQGACEASFGRQAALEELVAGSEARFAYIDDFVYYATTAPFGQMPKYPAATAVESLGDGEFRVSFVVLSTGMPLGLDAQGGRFELGEGFRSLSSDEMMSLLGVDNPSYGGEAVVRVDESVDGKKLAIVSFETASLETDANGEVSSGPEEVAYVDAGEPVFYENEYFSVALPSSWTDRWGVDFRETEHRPSANATNYGYFFSLDGVELFSIQRKYFNMYGSPERIGRASDGALIELHTSPGFSAEDEAFVRDHLELK